MGLTPTVADLWTSIDGTAWAPSSADPLGTITTGEGVGGFAGTIAGDGSHLLIYGPQGAAGTTNEYWTSLDGRHWTQLAETGPDSSAVTPAGRVSAFLMRDGVLFLTASGLPTGQSDPAWFGAASP